MKNIFTTIMLYTLIIGSIMLTGCESKSVNTFPPPEGYSNWDEYYQEHNQELPTPQPTETISSSQPSTTVSPTYTDTTIPTSTATPPEEITQALKYKVIDSYTEIVKVLYRDDTEIPGFPRESNFGDPVPKGFVLLKNTDNVAGTFTVTFSFWNRDKMTIIKDGKEISWYSMPDEEIFRNYHKGEVKLTLEAGESGTAEFIAFRIDGYETRDKGPWSWEYEVIPEVKITTALEGS